MVSDKTEIIDRAVQQASKDRRIANQEQELRLMKWVIAGIVGSLGALALAAVSIYRLDVVAEEVQAMPSPAEHQGVHALQDVDREHIKETVEEIQVQQTIDAEKIERTDRNVYKILIKLGAEG